MQTTTYIWENLTAEQILAVAQARTDRIVRIANQIKTMHSDEASVKAIRNEIARLIDENTSKNTFIGNEDDILACVQLKEDIRTQSAHDVAQCVQAMVDHVVEVEAAEEKATEKATGEKAQPVSAATSRDTLLPLPISLPASPSPSSSSMELQPLTTPMTISATKSS